MLFGKQPFLKHEAIVDISNYSWSLKEHYQAGSYSQDSGSKIFYIKKGMGKEKVVLLPGFLACSYSYRKVISILSEHYQALSLDWPGTGFSEPPQFTYSHRYLANVLSDFLEEIYGAEKVHIVCHGYSSQIVFLMLNQFPEKVKSLTMISTFLNLKKPVFPLPVGLLRIPGISYGLVQIYRPPFLEIIYNFLLGLKKSPLTKETIQDYYHLLWEGEKKYNSLKLCKNIDLSIHAQRDMESGLKKLIGFRQIIVCDRDPTNNEKQIEYLMEISRISNVQIISSGYLPMEENPLDLANKIMPLLELSNKIKNK